MMNSISPFGIKVNDYIDERRDFVKATRAALQKLEDNYRNLGDWHLALAAYNAGLGGVSRVVQRTGIRDYWVLCDRNEFRSETIHYVPKLLAVSYILSQPRRFGLDYWPETMDWVAIPLERQVSIDILAMEAGIERGILTRLNPELINGISPPDKNYLLKIPADSLAQVSEVLSREDLRLILYHRYIIQYGDTLSALARHYGVSLNVIEQHNPGILNRYLRIGETVIIPAYREVEPYRPSLSSQTPRAFNGTHLVKKGETLWSIAIAYGVDPLALAQANGMELNQILSEGKILKVPIIE
jgi:membrane-bound lytic murein transglycosylase D